MKKAAIIFVFIFLALSTPVFAQETASQTPTPVAPTPIQYSLPFPGLLPGSPLYPFKVARDRIVEFFISNTYKKADFYLLQADKHLGAGIIMDQKGKTREAEKYISKGENYLDKSLGKAIASRKAGESTDDIFHRIVLSSLKHEEILKGMINRSSGDLKVSLEKDLQKVQRIEINASQQEKAK